MKLVREHIDEKFKEQGDPIKDMGIGSYRMKKNFETKEKFIEFIVLLLPDILGTESIPEDILKDDTHWIKQEYHDLINLYNKKYITVNNETRMYNPQLLAIYLYRQGFKMSKGNLQYTKENNFI